MKINELNKALALSNLNLKLSALKEAINFPEDSILEYYPKTVRQFNLWESNQNSAKLQERYSSIKRNANSTLNKHPDLKAELIATLQSLILAQRNHTKSTKPEKISKLKSDIFELKRYISLLESYTANQKIELLRTQEHFKNEINRLNSVILELKKVTKNGNKDFMDH